MLILVVILYSILIGLIVSTGRKRFPIWIYILTAFLGACCGAAFSFGDSVLLLKYPLFNIWSVPFIFSVFFSLAALFADRGKVMLTILSIIIVVSAVAGLVYADRSPSDYSGLFREEITRAGIERVGHPIEGFSAPIYLEAFPGFETSDFNGVQSLEGIYRVEGEELRYERTADNPVTSAEDVLSEEGYKTLLSNLSNRLGLEIKNQADIATLLEILRKSDPVQSSYISDEFSIWFPEGWYAHELAPSVFFTRNEDLDIPQNTEFYAMGPYAQIVVEKTDIDTLMAQNMWEDGSEFLVTKDTVLIQNREAMKVITQAAGAGGEVLHYIFEDGERVFTLSFYPFERGSKDTDDFERAVLTFDPNYVINDVGDLPNSVGTTCDESAECAVPMKYMIQSNCPYQAFCRNNECIVGCPLWEHSPDPEISVSYRVTCQANDDCDCSAWDMANRYPCECVDDQCVSVVETK